LTEGFSVTSLSNGGATRAKAHTHVGFGNQSTSTGTLTHPFRYAARDRPGAVDNLH
jgi:hypothetical protein